MTDWWVFDVGVVVGVIVMMVVILVEDRINK